MILGVAVSCERQKMWLFLPALDCAQWPNTRTVEQKILYQNFVCAPLQSKTRDTITTNKETVTLRVPSYWLLTHTEDTLLYCLQQYSSKMSALLWTPPIQINLVTSHSKTCTQLLLISKTAEKRRFLRLCLEKLHSAAPCKSCLFHGEPQTLQLTREHVLAALGLQQKPLQESLWPTLTASAFDF